MSDEAKRTDWEVIYTYSRADAINDGELIDLTEWASSEKGFYGGFKVPVALTRALMETLKEFDDDSGEDIRGRVNDVLWMAAAAARSEKNKDENAVAFRVLATDKTGKHKELELFMMIGPGDTGEAVITIGYAEDF